MSLPDLHNPLRLEQGVLGALILHADELQQPEVRALRPHQFRHLGGLLHIVLELTGQGRDASIVELAQCMGHPRWPHHLTLNDLVELPAFALRPEDLAGAARGILAAYRREHAQTIAADMGRALAGGEVQDPLEVVTSAHAALGDLIGVSASDSTVSIADDLGGAVDRILHPQRHRGITTGIASWDAILGGWQPKTLNILAARPSMGKSAMMGQLAQAAAFGGPSNPAHALLFSLEDPEETVRMRALCRLSGVEIDHDRPPPANAPVRLSNAEAKLGSIRERWLIDPENHLDGIVSTCWQRHKEGRLDLVLIDQLSHILAAPTTQRASNRNELYGYITKTLKHDVAKRLSVPVILAHQLSRENAKKAAEPELTDLRDSGELEQDADSVTFIHRWDYYSPDERPGMAGLLVKKNRNGPPRDLIVQASMKTFKFWTGEHA